MGGLWRRMPVTFRTFAIGTAALAGFPLLTSGFYSKDAILSAAVHHGHPVLFGLGVLIAVMTTFYMLRLGIVAFGGEARSEAAAAAHESPSSMIWPLILLAVPSVAVAWLPLGDYLSNHFFGVEEPEGAGLFGPYNHAPLAAVFGTGALVFGAWASFHFYWGATEDPLARPLGWFGRVLRAKFGFDELYQGVFVALHDLVSQAADLFDRWVIVTIVRFVHGTFELVGRALRLAQTGNLQTYAVLFVFGVALTVILALR